MLKKLQKNYSIIKIIFFIFLIFNIENQSIAENIRNDKQLNKLFTQLKNINDLSSAQIIEGKIWAIWEKHPTQDTLTKSLSVGTEFMNAGQFVMAYNLFSNIIKKDPSWAESWNKRATLLYIMNRYQSSLADIKETLALEPRHFGALSGQALNYIELEEYEKAIGSLKDAQKIYPVIDAAKKMIPQLKEIINNQAI